MSETSYPSPNHHTHIPLRSAMKMKQQHPSRPSSSSPSPTSSPPIVLSPLSNDTTAYFPPPVSHSPSLLSRVPLPPSPAPPLPLSLPATPLPLPYTQLPPLHHTLTTPAPAPAPPLLSTSPTSTLDAPLPTAYTPKVSFDTFENPQASMFSFTLQVKSAGYMRLRNTRVYLCAASADESGREALDWCLESLAQDGDEVIVFRGVDEEVLEKDHDVVREHARELMRSIQEKSVEADSERKLSLILEYIPGKITDSLDRLIALYRPDSVVVGTRGRRGIMGVASGMGLGGMVGGGIGGIGSVSKYCLSHSPVPVIVVRPERKLKKAVEKRRADPKRGRHFES